MTSLTSSINLLPNMYGKMESMKLFPQKFVRTRNIAIEERNGVLNLLPTQHPGAPGTVGIQGKRKMRSFSIPHIPRDDVVLPEEVQGIRAFGSETELQAMAEVITDHLQSMRNKRAITLEHLRMGALKGYILDADSSTLYNLYDEFEIAGLGVSISRSWIISNLFLNGVKDVELITPTCNRKHHISSYYHGNNTWHDHRHFCVAWNRQNNYTKIV
jgi:hypothetical protein